MFSNSVSRIYAPSNNYNNKSYMFTYGRYNNYNSNSRWTFKQHVSIDWAILKSFSTVMRFVYRKIWRSPTQVETCCKSHILSFLLLLLLLLLLLCDIFVNCNWVDTRWQQYNTHLQTNSTQNNAMKQNTQNGTYIHTYIHNNNNT